VTNEQGADACPDGDALVAEIGAILGEDRLGYVRDPADAIVVVRFARGEEGVSAHLTVRDGEGPTSLGRTHAPPRRSA
jgi:hypothetical protein